jgi:hypothetical protein
MAPHISPKIRKGIPEKRKGIKAGYPNQIIYSSESFTALNSDGKFESDSMLSPQ